LLRRRLQFSGVACIAAAICGSSIATAQALPAAVSDQSATEQTQPAATPTPSNQTPPATTPPPPPADRSQVQDQVASPVAPPRDQSREPPQQPPPSKSPPGAETVRAGTSKSDTARSEAGKTEGAKAEATGAKTEGSKAEGARSEASRPEASKSEASRTEPARSEGVKPESAKVDAKTEGGRPAQARSAPAEGGQAAGQSRRVQPTEPAPEQGRAGSEQQPGSQAAGAAGKPGVQPAAVSPRQPQPPFSFAMVEKLAQERAGRPYRNRSTQLPDAIAKLTHDQYRDIRFQRTSALWYGHALFEVQFFHRGFNFDRRVNISEVSGGVARPVLYNPAMFDFGPQVPKMELPADLGFAGFRIHYPLNTPAYKDELIVFLGASYFRVLGRNQVYGLSARGLAIDTGAASGEEFPYFTDFWLVKPEPTARTMTVYALLDSPGIAGAYQFEIRPGTTTQVQVTAELYPRRQIAKLGIAPLTSMFLYGENSGTHRFDDFRPEVHDSDGLMTERGTGEWMWRPLVNPKELRVNRFMDEHPRGFAFVQRDRDFNHYQDNESRYERRPSYRVEPLGDWGKGGVELVEIPSDEEIHDNIVAYWVPDAPVQPQKPMTFSYLLSAYTGTTQWPPGGKVIATHFSRVLSGTNVVPGFRRVIVDFAGGDLDSLGGAQPVQAEANASGGEIDDISVERLAANGVWRVSMRLKAGDKPVDLRCYLTLYGEALTETWTYLWAPGT
jgi:periplasmic glucans biosynthesis protein